ncbi:hypothetical protein SAMN05421493_11830 [Pseudobutyrivibrio sp. 49]|uniref:hypothetical protein n=1 Tax=Pseudobutyrivibrio sp. 49 TaxID=1855344 RepID=UPI000882AD25|nr:hypothetical protein [Pseudobutyrivibrio sp. 49]SDI56607.1 hypothetical protein SAMN05421493_11830 [Pseudobutyrivibrio sp. 49]
MKYVAFQYEDEDVNDWGGELIGIEQDSVISIEANDLEDAEFEYLNYLYDLYNVRHDFNWMLNQEFVKYVALSCDNLEYPEKMHAYVSELQGAEDRYLDEHYDDDVDDEEDPEQQLVNYLQDIFHDSDEIKKLSEVDKKSLWLTIKPTKYKIMLAPSIDAKWKDLYRRQILDIENVHEYEALTVLCAYIRKAEDLVIEINVTDLKDYGYSYKDAVCIIENIRNIGEKRFLVTTCEGHDSWALIEFSDYIQGEKVGLIITERFKRLVKEGYDFMGAFKGYESQLLKVK